MQGRQELLRHSFGLGVILVLGLGCSHSETNEESGVRQASQSLEQGSNSRVRIGEEFDPNAIQYGPPVTSSVTPAGIAYDGKNYVIAWQYDGNNKFFSQVGRYSVEFGRLDDVPIDLYDSGAEPPLTVEVASDGRGSILAYQICDGATYSSCHYRFKRLDENGKVLDPVGLKLTDETVSTRYLKIVGSPKGYLAVWTEQDAASYTEPYHLRGAIIDAHATTPVGQPFVIADTLASTASCTVKLAVAASDTNYLVAYTKPSGEGFNTGFDVVASRITFDGSVMPEAEGDGSSVLKLGGSSNSDIALASDGRDYLLAFTDFVDINGTDWTETVFSAKITEQGKFASDTPLQLGDLTHRYDFPSVTFDGSEYLVAYRQWQKNVSGHQTAATRVSRDGQVQTQSSFGLLSENGTLLMLPPKCGGLCVGAWARDIDGQTAVVAAPMVRGTPINERNATLVSVSPREESSSDVACNKTGCVEIFEAGYSRWSNGERQLLLSELDGKGTVVSSVPTVIAEYYGSSAYSAAVATDGEGYLVAWWERFDDVLSRIHVVALDGRGRVVPGTSHIAQITSDWPGTLKLASTGDGYLMVYRDYRSDKIASVGMTLDKLGNVIEKDTFTVERGYNVRVLPTQLVASKNQYLVVVRDEQGYLTFRVDKAGKVISHATEAGVLDRHLPASPRVPVGVASNGSEFLTVWFDPTATAESGKAQGVVRIAEDGTVTPITGELSPPVSGGALLWNGHAYLWSWTEQVAWGTSPYTQHFTEFTVGSDSAMLQRDTAVERSQFAGGMGKMAVSSEGLVWSYAVQTGHPDVPFYGPSRIRHRLISGLCFGDPKGDSNDNGICDSTEVLNLPETGTGGSSSVSSTLASGGSSSEIGSASSEIAKGGAESFSSASSSAGSASIDTGRATIAEGGKGGLSSASQSSSSSKAQVRDNGEHRDDDGCSCSTAGSRSPAQSWAWAMGIAALLGRHRRRRGAAA